MGDLQAREHQPFPYFPHPKYSFLFLDSWDVYTYIISNRSFVHLICSLITSNPKYKIILILCNMKLSECNFGKICSQLNNFIFNLTCTKLYNKKISNGFRAAISIKQWELCTCELCACELCACELCTCYLCTCELRTCELRTCDQC